MEPTVLPILRKKKKQKKKENKEKKTPVGRVSNCKNKHETSSYKNTDKKNPRLTVHPGHNVKMLLASINNYRLRTLRTHKVWVQSGVSLRCYRTCFHLSLNCTKVTRHTTGGTSGAGRNIPERSYHGATETRQTEMRLSGSARRLDYIGQPEGLPSSDLELSPANAGQAHC